MLISAATMASFVTPNRPRTARRRCDYGGERRNAGRGGDNKPPQRTQLRLPHDTEQDAEVRRDAFSTLEFQPNRKIVAEDAPRPAYIAGIWPK